MIKTTIDNVKNIHGIKIEKLDSDHEISLSKKIKKSARLENLKNDVKIFKDNFLSNKAKQFSMAKVKLTEINIALPAVKKAFKDDKKRIANELKIELQNIEGKREENLIKEHSEKLNAKHERIAEYLNHKFVNNAEQLEIELTNNQNDLDKGLSKEFKVDDFKIDTEIAIAKEVSSKKLVELEKSLNVEIASLLEKKAVEKLAYQERKAEINARNKELKLKKKAEFAEKKKKIIDEFKIAKEEVKANQLYFNAFGEAVSEESFTSSKDIDKFKYLIPKISDPNKNQEKLVSEINKLEEKIEKINEDYSGGFDQKVELIEARVKIKYFVRMINIHENAKKEISTLEKKLIKVDTPENKEAIKIRQNEELGKLKINFDKRIQEIKHGYGNGKFSKLSYKNSLEEAKKAYKESKKEILFNDEVSSLKGQIKYRSYQIKSEVVKEEKIMFSEIDDSQRNIPTKFNKNAIYYSTFASLFLPGVGQLLNKQYLKGVMLLFVSLFIYGLLLPMVFGAISFRGDGVFGLGVLSPVIGESSSGGYIYLDARYRIVEGVLSVIALTVAVALIYLSARDANKVAKASWFGGRPKNARDLKNFLTNKGLPMVLSTPAIFMILLVVVLPLATTLLLAFTDYSSLTQPPGNGLSWVGWENFKRVFIGDYGKSFAFVSLWTIIWTVGTTAGTIIVGTLLALVVDNERIKGKTMWFMIYILPWAVPAFATILFFTAAFTNGGLINDFFNVETNFKQSTNWTRVILITIQVWLGNAYIFMLMSGVKKSISDDYYEAASMDGASKSKQFWTITAPIILFQIMPLLIGQVIFNFNNYGVIWMFNDGGPSTAESLIGNPGSTDIIISFIFKLTTNSQNRIALASAFTIVVSLGVVSLAAIGFFRSKSFKEDKL